MNPKGGHHCPLGGCSTFPGTFIFTTGGDFGPGLTSRNFTAPTAPGTYQMGFFAYFDRDPVSTSWCDNPTGGPGNCTTPFSYGATAVIVVESDPQCSDNIDNNDNDNPPLSDEDDPQCHTDCNPNNPGSYAPNHNSETTPPNGTCPAPATLQLNGRAAFLQVVKNFVAFITTKAFAGE